MYNTCINSKIGLRGNLELFLRNSCWSIVNVGHFFRSASISRTYSGQSVCQSVSVSVTRVIRVVRVARITHITHKIGEKYKMGYN